MAQRAMHEITASARSVLAALQSVNPFVYSILVRGLDRRYNPKVQVRLAFSILLSAYRTTSEEVAGLQTALAEAQHLLQQVHGMITALHKNATESKATMYAKLNAEVSTDRAAYLGTCGGISLALGPGGIFTEILCFGLSSLIVESKLAELTKTINARAKELQGLMHLVAGIDNAAKNLLQT